MEYSDLPRINKKLSYRERSRLTISEDDEGKVIIRARVLMRQGSSQIKVMISGGVSSSNYALDVNQYKEAELKDALSGASN